ncbi:acyl carrier protein [Plantactinospora sp. KLBMP9567]|uniref:acyl carrier protein n=1 Tax=Plantactinospora sp. KLBMP9567 TaxID=3085900 RepID=UPI002982A66C|nr:acyl carrier protein [Plantactinospora sp. KLBMP9567]MDW5329223.1 acyl carrier protein [Plantactinospora sp. KLBMP9567]
MADSAAGDGVPEKDMADVMTVVVDAWRRVFERPDLGPDDDFFAAGGDSFRMVMLVTEIGDRYRLALDPVSFFDTPTPRQMSRVVAELLSRPR